jgi:hypothetical protein
LGEGGVREDASGLFTNSGNSCALKLQGGFCLLSNSGKFMGRGYPQKAKAQRAAPTSGISSFPTFILRTFLETNQKDAHRNHEPDREDSLSRRPTTRLMESHPEKILALF